MTANEINRKRFITEQFVGEDIEQYTQNHLGIDYRLALQGTLTPYVEYLISQSRTFQFQTKGRPELELVQELIYSRCVELRLLEKWGGKVILDGSDKDTLICRYATNRPDFWETGTQNHYEVISSFQGFFLSAQTIFITEDKLQNLCQYAGKYDIYVIAVDVIYQRYAFLPISPELDFAGIVHYAKGYNISLEGLEWFSLAEPDIINQRSEKIGDT